jgi:2-aminoadipate transaminase
VYLRSGGYDAQLPRSRSLYASRRRAMLDACATYLPAGVTWTEPDGGFFTWLTTPGVDTAALAGRAEAAGVAFVPGAPFYASAGSGTAQLRLSYSRAQPVDIDEGMRRLGALLAGAATS